MASMTPLRRRVRSQKGAELIEMALVMPLLLLIILGIVDFGFLFRELLVVTNAAREGARAGVLTGYDDADVNARIDQYLSASGIDGACASGVDCDVSLLCMPGGGAPPCAAGDYRVRSVAVTLDHDFVFLGPFATLLSPSVPLTGRAVMRVEGP